MKQYECVCAAALAAAAFALSASADFFNGAPVFATGSAFNGPGGYTSWGTGAASDPFQGYHILGTTTAFWETGSGANNPIYVSSTVNSQYSVTITIDFTQMQLEQYGVADFYIGLKDDTSLIGVQGNLAGVYTNGSGVLWQGGTSAILDLGGIVSFKVYQAPAPGGLALLALAGVAGRRKRR